jgi:hypothetical protein
MAFGSKHPLEHQTKPELHLLLRRLEGRPEIKPCDTDQLTADDHH